MSELKMIKCVSCGKTPIYQPCNTFIISDPYGKFKNPTVDVYLCECGTRIVANQETQKIIRFKKAGEKWQVFAEAQ